MLYRSLGKQRKLWSLLIIALFLGFLYLFLTEITLDQRQTWLVIAVATYSIVSAHRKRADIEFLLTHLRRKSVYILLFIEYLLLIIPIIALLCYKGDVYSLYLVLLPLLLPLLPRQKANSNRSISIFEKGNIEWNSGLRSYKNIHFALFVLFIASSIYQVNFNLSLVLMAINIFFFSIYYNVYESDQMIIKYNNPEELLKSKIVFFTKNIVLIGIIFTSLISLMYMDFNWYALMIIAQIWILIYTIIVVKYAFYPNKMAGEMQMTIFALMCLIPFLAPFSLIIAFYYHGVAKKRLHKYFA